MRDFNFGSMATGREFSRAPKWRRSLMSLLVSLGAECSGGQGRSAWGCRRVEDHPARIGRDSASSAAGVKLKSSSSGHRTITCSPLL
jgi:hypothetical protein